MSRCYLLKYGQFCPSKKQKLSSIAFRYMTSQATDCKNVVCCCPHMLKCKLAADWSIANESTYGP